jgi:small subunit ribosomal protein S1
MQTEHNKPTTPGTPTQDLAAGSSDAHQDAVVKKYNFSDIEEREYTENEYNELSRLYDKTFHNIQEEQIIKGKIVAITDNAVAIDIGFKSEGLVPITEFPNIDELNPGDEIEVYLESVENKDGQLVLSRKRADFIRTWERIVKAYENSEILQGKITRRIKGDRKSVV